MVELGFSSSHGMICKIRLRIFLEPLLHVSFYSDDAPLTSVMTPSKRPAACMVYLGESFGDLFSFGLQCHQDLKSDIAWWSR
ncbi:hypothetical protein HZ326_6278 [Fusarium oxysporum f. sp. albedinis]|nr:hypothetical protein HZ326_6278 [Fusarium oxysporum f. sp. albedinis]